MNNSEKPSIKKETENNKDLFLRKFSSKSAKEQSERQMAFRYSHLGLQLAVTFGVFIIGGYYLDKYAESSPWGIVAGAIIGFAVGLYQLLKGANELTEQMEKIEKQKYDSPQNVKKKDDTINNFDAPKPKN